MRGNQMKSTEIKWNHMEITGGAPIYAWRERKREIDISWITYKGRGDGR